MTADDDDHPSAKEAPPASAREPDHEPDREHGPAQYFDGDPVVASEPVTIDVTLPDTAFTLQTDRGVFARGQLDTGTSLLLRSPDVPLASTGHLLDLGCGAGPIALTMARRSPDAIVWAIDVNRRALQLCRDNARANGLTNITVCLPDEIPPEVRFDSIWSNPPIRIGKASLHDLLLHWLQRMTPGATCALVVQKHLGADSLQRWLDEQGFETQRLASKAGFRLFRVSAAAA